MENNLKAKVEAALFLTEKPLKAAAVAKIVQEDLDKVRRTILELIRDYEERDLGLEISDDNGYIIQVKDAFSTLIDEFVPLEIPTSLIRTLSAIAIKQPVMQSEIIKIRGAGAYEHIKELMERDLVNKKEDGRSPTLTTTKKFQEYFRLSKDGNSLRQVLIKQDQELEESEKESALVGGDTFDASPQTITDSTVDLKTDSVHQQTLNLDLTQGEYDDDSEEQQEIPTFDARPESSQKPEIEEQSKSEGEDNSRTPLPDMEGENQTEALNQNNHALSVENISPTSQLVGDL